MVGIEVKICVCVRIHLDVIKPRDRKNIIFANCYILDGLNASQGKLLCTQFRNRYG